MSMKVLIVSADNFEDSELLVPYYRLREEGIAVDIASMKTGAFKGVERHRERSERKKRLLKSQNIFSRPLSLSQLSAMGHKP
jgi:putative intracellular protease/amidase